MESFRELFDLYKRGSLAEEKIDELNRSLIEIYFRSPEDMNQDESDYTEDLIFELFAGNNLEEQFALIFRERIRKDTSLSKKYLLSKELSEGADLLRNRGIYQLTENDPADENEEAQLKGILEEVFEKVHAEKEASPVKDALDSFVIFVKNIILEIISSVQFNQPRVKLVMVIGSIAIIAGIAWLLLKPGETVMVTDNKIKQPGKTNAPVVTEKLPLEENAESLKEAIQKRMNDLIATSFKRVVRFDYLLTRGESTSSEDLFILAAEKYNEQKFDSCIIILKELLGRKAFTIPDTINEINFYLGNCRLIMGINQNSDRLLKQSLQSFQRIDPKNHYYNMAKWYSVFAYAKLGQPERSLDLCEILMKVPHLPNYIEVKQMRDSVQKLIDFSSETLPTR